MKLSVVIPSYNEAATVRQVVERVRALPIEKEIVVVDDGSTDGTWELLRAIPGIVALRHELNRGKGAALRTGFARATGEVLVVQDADLEYYPEDLVGMLRHLEEKGLPIVFGSRNLGFDLGIEQRGRGRRSFYLGGKLVGAAANLLFGLRLTDEPTCYKMFRREVLEKVRLRCTRFEFCPEFVARAAKAGYRFVEVPIRYAPRGKAEGKKINYRDGLHAIAVLVGIRLGLW